MNGLYQDYQQEYSGKCLFFHQLMASKIDLCDFGNGDFLNSFDDDTDTFPMNYIEKYESKDLGLEENQIVLPPKGLFYSNVQEPPSPKRSPSPPATQKSVVIKKEKRETSNSVLSQRSSVKSRTTTNTTTTNRRTGYKRKRHIDSQAHLLKKDPDSMSPQEKEELRKLKNRESARASRQRRKKYIEDLESTNQSLSSQNSKLWKTNRSLSTQNQQLREVIRIITAQSFMKQYQLKNQNQIIATPPETDSTEPARKKQKIDNHPPAMNMNPNNTQTSVPRKNPMGNYNPFNSEFWQVSLPQDHLGVMNGKKTMMLVLFFVAVISFFLANPFGRDDYLLNQYLTNPERSTYHSISQKNLESLNRELLSLSDVENIISRREELKDILESFNEEMWNLLEEEYTSLRQDEEGGEEGEIRILSDLLSVSEDGKRLGLKIDFDDEFFSSILQHQDEFSSEVLKDICNQMLE